MSREQFINKNFKPATLAIIAAANEIIDEYRAQGFVLTLRQLYYQFVARGLLPNTTRSYKNLGKTINNARLAGLVDWQAIEAHRDPDLWAERCDQRDLDVNDLDDIIGDLE